MPATQNTAIQNVYHIQGNLQDGLELAALLVMLSPTFLGLPRGRPEEDISTPGRDEVKAVNALRRVKTMETMETKKKALMKLV